MAYFPFFRDLTGLPGLIVGGGQVALRKAEKLLSYGPKLTAAAPCICPEFRALPGVTLLEQPFSPELLEGMAFVIAATDDRALNHEISLCCRDRSIPVNVADCREDCTFLFPSLVKKGSLSIGISTGGASPSAAAELRRKLEDLLPDNTDALLEDLEAKRPLVQETVADPSRRARVFKELFSASMAKGASLSDDEFAAILGGVSPEKHGRVALVGAGCGKADLITLRGLKLLRSCEVLVYDDLIDEALLAEAPDSAERIYMGKRLGRHSASQSEISAMLVEKAREGKQVVRLKGGDPYVFGRGGEEFLALQSAGIPCEEVPGISSCIAIPAAAGIPVTHRSLSRSFHVVTAHTADTGDYLPDDLDALAGLRGTLVFLMGLKQLPRLAERLMAAGKAAETPAAVISGGNAPRPMTVRASLCDIARAAEEAGVEAPAVIVVGETAALELL